jgi:hypothetical protein
MQIVHTDNRLITADCDSSRQRERPISTNLQESDRNKCLVLSLKWVLYTKTDWPTDQRSNITLTLTLIRGPRQPPAHARSSLTDSCTLKMKIICSSETSLHTISTRRKIPEDDILHSHRCENLKSYIYQYIYMRILFICNEYE